MMYTTQFKLKGKILSPISIRNGEEWTILDYMITQEGTKLSIIDQNWIYDAIIDGKVQKDKLLQAIAQGNFQMIQTAKNTLDAYHVLEKYDLAPNAAKTLGQVNNSSNQGKIKQHICEKFTGIPIIPGSTIKGMLRTAYLLWLKDKKKIDLTKLEEDNKNMKILDTNLFQRLSVPDVQIKNNQIKIQQFTAYGKPKPQTQVTQRGISINFQSVIQGDFDIIISVSQTDMEYDHLTNFIDNFDQILYYYAAVVRKRENYIAEKIQYSGDFVQYLKTQFNIDRQYPIKLGSHKKSHTYRLDRYKAIENLNNRYDGKERQIQSRRQGIGDKTLYLDEDEKPVGWVLLSRI